MSTALASIDVGVVAERRDAANPWIDHVWTPSAVVHGAPAAEPWTIIHEDNGRAEFFVGLAKIELFASATAHYRDNLASGDPRVWVILRPTGVSPPFDLVAVTADPAEGEGYTQAGADLVDAVTMPASIIEFVAGFVAEHHVEREFFKRKRDRHPSDALSKRPRGDNDER
ncbi:hypothetical protein GJW-30_1_02935 [Variibacter gotjawalensis]|uniref:Molybdopterin-guanine dinucleotide biosynthesis protein A n=1 Tax=Variibacter gotjawalensis TaxID=1333996 RepID=A0A0S3PWW8_9BRAD|nr:DUF3305 domain-containing protein [Variibacter gotjawalensis]NIK46225.1 hypothetical protein [Variibacter gotjawalensis]RZS48141.1 uncharacterized protein DUF3305 [Variibacter gotjawalensis]BAT60398.1 hypothetical protein GJW-30_1_02935 [Variibacter gotjawalensis]